MTRECVGFVECRCAKCLADPAQREAKRRLAAMRAKYAIPVKQYNPGR